MDPVRTAFFVVAVPAIVAAVVLLVLVAIRRGRQDAAVAGPALAAAFVAGFLGAAGVPKLPPTEAWHWIPAIAALAAAVGLADRGATRLRWILRAVVAAGAAWVTDVDRTPARVAAVVAAVLLVDAAFDGAARRAGPRALLATVAVVAAATSVALVATGTARLGTACGALAASAGACLLVASRVPVAVTGAAVVAGTSLAAFWMNGVLYAETPLQTALLLAAAPFAAWTPVRAAADRPVRAAIVRTALVALVAGAAVAVAVVYAPKSEY